MISDTNPEAAARQLEKFRRMTPSERVQMAIQLSDSMCEVALCGIRLRHPLMTVEEQKYELMRIKYGLVPSK